MTTEDFFEALQQQFIRKMPFVAYRKPKDISVKALFQHEDTIHYSSDLSESGFVFAPFDDREQTVFMPLHASEVMSCDVEIINSEENNNK